MSKDWTNSSTVKVDVITMIKKTKLAHRCSKLIIVTYVTAVFVYTYIFYEFLRRSENKESALTSRELLMKMDLPPVCYKNSVYDYVILVQFIQLLINASAISVLDALIVTLMFYTGGQIEMLHNALADIPVAHKNVGLRKDVIKSLIDRHYRIIDSSEVIEILFTYIALMQLLCNTLIICCTGFLMVIALDSDGNVRILVKTLFFYAAIMLEAFIFSFAGEYLGNKNFSISYSAYNSLWYSLHPRDIRSLILLMVRSQRRTTITAGKFMDLSLESFANILKASASYVSVLYAMYHIG